MGWFIYPIVILVCAASIQLTSKGQLSQSEIYKRANLTFSSGEPEQHNAVAVAEDIGKFFFAAGAPYELTPSLFFHETKEIRFQIKPFYYDKNCNGEAKSKAQLRFRSSLETHNVNLDGNHHQLVIPVLAGDSIDVLLTNSSDMDCG